MSMGVAAKVVGEHRPVEVEFSRHTVRITVGYRGDSMGTEIKRREWDAIVKTGLIWIPGKREE